MTPDQQGRWYYDHLKFPEAMETFESPSWKGLSAYHSGKYIEAAAAFAQIPNAEGLYNMGNSFMKSRDYGKAIQAYELAVAEAPGWSDAEENLKLARYVLEYIERTRESSDTGDETELVLTNSNSTIRKKKDWRSPSPNKVRSNRNPQKSGCAQSILKRVISYVFALWWNKVERHCHEQPGTRVPKRSRPKSGKADLHAAVSSPILLATIHPFNFSAIAYPPYPNYPSRCPSSRPRQTIPTHSSNSRRSGRRPIDQIADIGFRPYMVLGTSPISFL